MPKHTFIAELAPGGVASTYLVRQSRLLKTVRGDDYLAVKLADRTGEIDAKLWQAPPDAVDVFAPGRFVDVVGRVEAFRERNQVIIDQFEPREPADIDQSLYRVTAPIDPVRIHGEIVAMLEGMTDPWLVALAQAYLADETFGSRFREWPAAKRMHHPYLHGLLEHVHSVMSLGVQLARHYPWVDGDLVLMGLFIHDSGKVIELVSEPGPGYSIEGELLGHITIGICKLDELARTIEDFPRQRLLQLKHIILSHHGIAEYGSPKPPMFAEALLIHTVEMLDAKVNAFYRERELPAENSDADGSIRYSRLLKHGVYVPPPSPEDGVERERT